MTSFCQRILFVFLCVFIGVATPQCVTGPPGIGPIGNIGLQNQKGEPGAPGADCSNGYNGEPGQDGLSGGSDLKERLGVNGTAEPKPQKSESDNYTSLITIISVIGGFLLVTDVVLVLLFLQLRKAMILLQSKIDQRYEVLHRPSPFGEQGLYNRIQSLTSENSEHHSYMEVIDGHI